MLTHRPQVVRSKLGTLVVARDYYYSSVYLEGTRSRRHGVALVTKQCSLDARVGRTRSEERKRMERVTYPLCKCGSVNMF